MCFCYNIIHEPNNLTEKRFIPAWGFRVYHSREGMGEQDNSPHDSQEHTERMTTMPRFSSSFISSRSLTYRMVLPAFREVLQLSSSSLQTPSQTYPDMCYASCLSTYQSIKLTIKLPITMYKGKSPHVRKRISRNCPQEALLDFTSAPPPPVCSNK